jgi:hypothetical protein
MSSDLSPISADIAAYVSLNADGYIQVDENSYPGGNLDLAIKADNTYDTPTKKEIKLTEKCVAATVTNRNADAWEFDVVENFVASFTALNKPSIEMENSNPTACPITFSVVDSDGAAVSDAVAAYIAIDGNGDLIVTGD